MASKHPGFKKVAQSIAAKQGVSMDRASAMLAASTRRASPAAKRKNPRLNRVKMREKAMSEGGVSGPSRARKYI